MAETQSSSKQFYGTLLSALPPSTASLQVLVTSVRGGFVALMHNADTRIRAPVA